MENSNKKYVRFRYSEKDLENACHDIISGTLSLNAAHKKYNIPKSTLHNKVTQKVPMQRKLGPFTQLAQPEEDLLAEWVIKKAKSGFPMRPEELQMTVKKYLDANARRATFIDNKPGRKWLQLFLKRHPEISKRNAEVISRARASVTEASIRKWFDELNKFLVENEAHDIMEHPERVFNADETGVQMCPKSGAVLAPKNFKNSYQIASGKEKEQVTVLCNISANGNSAPPMLVYPYKRIPRIIVDSMPDEWGIGRSDSGWMISETFLDYIKNIFFPWLVQKNIAFPVIMFLDGHRSHINKELFEYCTTNKILLFCLFPNATHILQPCDVSFFKSLKNAWRDAVSKFKAEHPTKVLNRNNFAGVFKMAYDNTISKRDVISNGFKKCGLYPLDPNSVDYTKCVTTCSAVEQEADDTLTISNIDVKSTMKVIKHLTTNADIEEFNVSMDENKTHCHPYFPIWLFCKSFLTSKDMTVPLTGTSQGKENNIELSEIGLNQEKNRSLAGSPENDSDVTNASWELLVTNALIHDVAELNTDDTLNSDRDIAKYGDEISISENNETVLNTIAKYCDDISINAISENNVLNTCVILDDLLKSCDDLSVAGVPNKETQTELDIHEKESSRINNKTTQNIEAFLTIPNLNKTTQKRKTTIMPYGITCSKMKDYFNEQDIKKREKEEIIQRKKALRLEKALKKDATKTVLKKKNKKLEKPKTDVELTDEDTTEDDENKNIGLKNHDLDIRKESRKKRINDENDLIIETKRTISIEAHSTQFCSESVFKFADISVGSFILVKFKQPKSIKLFAGKVLMINDDEKKIKVDFLRKKRQKNTDCELFVYPQVKDVYEIGIASVVEILLVKNTTRRGEIMFTKDLKNVH